MSSSAITAEAVSEEKNIEENGTSKMRKCPKCKAHGQDTIWKGHKRLCPYKRCSCVRCKLVDERRHITKQQVRLYRNPDESPADALNGLDGIQEPLEKRLNRAAVDVPTLYLVILKACHYDLERSMMVIAQAKEEIKHAQEQATLYSQMLCF